MSFIDIQKARIAASFNTDEGLSELTKAEIIDIEKGGKRAMIGEKRTFAGREYIKTASGWKFHGKGTGSKAQEHVAGALEHHVGEMKVKNNIPIEEIEDLATKLSQFADKESEKEKIVEELKNMSFDKDMKPTSSVSKLTELLNFTSDIGTEHYIRVGFRHLKNDNLEESPKPIKHKNATDHFVEEDGKHYIDTLDPDTGEKKFKPGDKVHYIDDNGKKHKGTISDREHEDGDMFEVDREENDKVGAVEKLDPKEITNKQYSSEAEKSMGEESIKKLKKLNKQHEAGLADKPYKSALSDEESEKLQSRMRSKIKEQDEER